MPAVPYRAGLGDQAPGALSHDLVARGLHAARTAIETEAAAVSALAGRLDGVFLDVLETVARCQGHLIVTGLGKSGLVGRKIAATLASTGTPASFIHAGDALHGDSGAVTHRDIVLALSASGETAEVCAFARMLVEREIPVIAMTGQETSTLAGLATYTLDTMVPREADPLNLAPTASTTAALVMGDALACALVVLRDFTQHDFARFHPSGALGRRLLGGGLMTSYDVVVLGSFMKDLVASAERRPLPGETLHGTGFAEFLGGKGVNQAVAAARMGAVTAIIGTVGEDRYGEEFLDLLGQHGVDTGQVVRHPRLGTGVGLPVVLPDGSNSIIIVSRANAAITADQVDAAADVLTNCRVLSVQLELPVDASRAALRIASRAGATTILTPAPAGPVDSGLAEVVDILVPNEVEAAALTGQSCDDEDGLPAIARRLSDEWGLRGCVITLGSRGVFVLDRSNGLEVAERIGGHRVATVDTVGAGDAFCGSLAASLAAGDPLLDAARLANAAGALSTTVSGAAASAPTRAEALALLLGSDPHAADRAAFPVGPPPA